MFTFNCPLETHVFFDVSTEAINEIVYLSVAMVIGVIEQTITVDCDK